MKIALLVLTDRGLGLARRLREALPGDSTIYGPSCVVGPCLRGGPAIVPTDIHGVSAWIGPLRGAFPTIWAEHDAIVAVMALGIVVRLAGPLAVDKRRDPAVVAVDDAGRFAVAVLGGHGAGANALTHQVAAILGATPVVTTASDAHGLPAVDLIGAGLGWKVEGRANLTRAAAAVVRGEAVGIYQDAGEADWWRPFGPWPTHFRRVERPADAALLISDRVFADANPGAVVYRPPSLVAGIGCKRGVPMGTIAGFLEEVLAGHGLASNSLAAIATVTLKADEPGLIALADARKLPLLAFRPDELAGTPGVERPSEQVRRKIGIPAVAEPAALRAAGATRLVVPKQKGPGVTVAVARLAQPPPIMKAGGPYVGA